MTTSTKKKRASGRDISLPKRFVPRFLDGQDARLAVVKEIRRRVKALQQDCGADSFQKRMLCQRAIFLSLQLETAEVNALSQDAPFDAGVYVQAVNALSGLLSKLGLERAVRKSNGLKAYLEERQA